MISIISLYSLYSYGMYKIVFFWRKECIKLLPLCCASRAAEVGTISATLLLASAPSWYVLHLDSYQTNAQYVFFIYKDMGLHMTHNIEVWTCNLSLRILANSEAREAGHVAGRSRPSDRPGGWLRSCFSRSFCKRKTLKLKRNQPALQVPLSENFAKKPLAFLEINPQSNSAGWRKFVNKTLSFHKINSSSLSSLMFFFFKKPSAFNWSKPQPVSSITSTLATLYVQFKHQNVLE